MFVLFMFLLRREGIIEVGVIKCKKNKWIMLMPMPFTPLAGYKPNNEYLADMGSHGTTAVIHVSTRAGGN